MYLDTCRSVYNWNNGERKDWIQSRKSLIDRCSIKKEYIIPADKPFPNYNIQANNLTQSKKQYPYLAQVHSQVLQSTLKRLDQAWDDFFKVESRGFPKFKNKNRFRSFVYPQIKSSDLQDNQIRLPKIGWVRIRKSREYPTGFEPKQLRIVRKATGYFAQIILVSDESVPDVVPGKTSLGLDAGISSFVASSRGELIKIPEFVLRAARKLKSASDPAPPTDVYPRMGTRLVLEWGERASLLQRRLKNKIKGSSNWLKLQKKIASLHFKVANRREDWLYKLAHYFCSITDNIFVEDLNFKAWQKGLFGKQIGNSAIGKFINQILPFIAWKTRVYYEKVDKNFTSQECPNCRLPTGKKTLKQRIHNCQYCGVTLDRDVAAAKVIESRGRIAVGQPAINKFTCGDRVTGVLQLTLFAAEGTRSDLVTDQ